MASPGSAITSPMLSASPFVSPMVSPGRSGASPGSVSQTDR
jgi:hypothetical protein